MKPDLDAIRQRCEAATPGPWGFSSFERRYILDDTTDVVGEVAPTDTGAAITVFSVATGALEDAEFIALARTDIPALLAYIDDLEHERDGWKFNACDARDRIAMLEHMLAEERENVDTLRERVAELEAARDCLPPVNAEHEAIIDALLAKAHEGAAKRPIERDAYRRGAEAMRLACQEWCIAWENEGRDIADALADLAIPEER